MVPKLADAQGPVPNYSFLRNTQKMRVADAELGYFTAREASRLAGFEKPWMLNHLEREEIFTPERQIRGQQGKHRAYTFRDLVILRAINRLLKLGARPRRVRESIQTFSEVCPSSTGEDDLIHFARSASLFIVTDAKVIFCEEPGKLIDLAARGQLAFSFMVGTGREIGPSIEAGLTYLRHIRAGTARTDKLLEETALRFNL